MTSSQISVALDVSPLYWEERPIAGIPRVTSDLVSAYASADDVRLVPFVLRDQRETRFPGPSGRGAFRRADIRVRHIPSADDVPRCTFVHFLYVYPDGFRASGCTPILTVHDLRPLLYPGLYAGDGGWMSSAILRCWESRGGVHVWSDVVRAELRGYFGRDCGPIAVIRPLESAPAGPLAAVPEVADRPFGLMLGTEHANKNHLEVLAAWHQLVSRGDASGADARLVLAGARGTASPAIDRFLDESGLTSVVRLGQVPEDRRQWLLHHSSFLVQFSFHEGAGLPAIEARASGVPVIASEIQAHREFLDGAATFVRLGDADRLRSAMRSLLRSRDGRRADVRRRRVTQRRNGSDRDRFAHEFLDFLGLLRNRGDRTATARRPAGRVP